MRGLAAWVVGLVFVWADQTHDYDLRLQIRGTQTYDDSIVLVLIPRAEWLKLQGQTSNYFRPLKESSYFNDSFYWNARLWQSLLKQILGDQPQVVGVTIYFGENIPRPSDETLLSPILTDRRIVWATQIDSEGRILTSRFARTYSRNAGLNELSFDRDGAVRRFYSNGEPIPHIANQLTRENLLDREEVINFRGRANTFPVITAEKVLKGDFPENFFRNKIVIIGGQDSEGQLLRTPVGPMSRAEIIANIVDNTRHERWIKSLHPGLTAILLLIIVIFSALVTSHYPQFLAFFVLTFVQAVYAVASIFLFDYFNLWIPLFASLVSTFSTYMIFISFQLTLKDYVNVQLEKERQFLLAVEELKNNFLSLISHDLKTPIAKIQAICDRILAESPNTAITGDVTALREEATELHRYIHTILQITRVESRDFRIKKDASDINEIITSVTSKLQVLAKNKKIELTLDLEPMFLIEVDTVLMREVVLNLIENAIKYTQEGGRVAISSREIDDHVYVVVEDNGPGIPKEEQDRVFEKFYRGELGKSQPKGSGLGLYLVKYFVELHSGQIIFESEPKRGTKIGFRLPLATTDEPRMEGTENEAVS